MINVTRTVTSVAEYLEWSRDVRRNTRHVLYRGQRKPWPMLPSIARLGEPSTLIKRETALLKQFKKQAKRCLHRIPENDWDWLVVAQHHGLPTRLLDWTSEPKTALWFALEKIAENNDSEPIVWQLCPDAKDFVTDQSSSRPFSGTRTKLFETTFDIPRVRAQHGKFSLTKHDETFCKGFVPLEQNRFLRDALQGVKVSVEHAESMLSELEKDGLKSDWIYPPSVDEVAERVKNLVLNEIQG